jgi:hypothetical protein
MQQSVIAYSGLFAKLKKKTSQNLATIVFPYHAILQIYSCSYHQERNRNIEMLESSSAQLMRLGFLDLPSDTHLQGMVSLYILIQGTRYNFTHTIVLMRAHGNGAGNGIIFDNTQTLSVTFT